MKEKKDKGPEQNFHQPVKKTSLVLDALKRLRKNKMAVAGLMVVVIYAIISLFAPLLPIYSYRFQILDHRFLPPSFKPAGKILLEKEKARLLVLAHKEGRETLDPEELRILATYEKTLQKETMIIDDREVWIHERIYFCGTDSLAPAV